MTARVDAIYESALPPDEFERRLKLALAELDGPEGKEIADHIGWFRRRYPSSLARLDYARRKYREAMRTRGLAR